MLERMLTVLVAVPIIFMSAYLGGLWFFALVAVLTLISLNEFYNMMKAKGMSPYYTIGNLFTLCIIVFVQFTLKHPNWEPVSSLILTSAIITTFSAAIFIRRSSMAVANIGITILGVLYIGWLFSYLVFLRALTPHGIYLFLLMFSIWGNDSAAYLFGKRFGKKQLSPIISPNKTVEGAIAGLVMAIAVSMFFGMMIEQAHFALNWFHYLAVGAIIGIFGQISDLSESLIKRDAGFKDSSKIVPGHGGVLDRMDSFIFTAPLLYYYVSWFLMR